MEENKTVPQISKKGFTEDVNNRMNKAQLAEKYNISPANVSKIVKDLGLKLAKTVKPAYELVEDEGEIITHNTTPEQLPVDDVEVGNVDGSMN